MGPNRACIDGVTRLTCELGTRRMLRLVGIVVGPTMSSDIPPRQPSHVFLWLEGMRLSGSCCSLNLVGGVKDEATAVITGLGFR